MHILDETNEIDKHSPSQDEHQGYAILVDLQRISLLMAKIYEFKNRDAFFERDFPLETLFLRICGGLATHSWQFVHNSLVLVAEKVKVLTNHLVYPLRRLCGIHLILPQDNNPPAINYINFKLKIWISSSEFQFHFEKSFSNLPFRFEPLPTISSNWKFWFQQLMDRILACTALTSA